MIRHFIHGNKRFLSGIVLTLLIPATVILCAALIINSSSATAVTLQTTANEEGFSHHNDITHTVTFLDDKGEVLESTEVRNGETLSCIPRVYDRDNIFLGWDVPIYTNLKMQDRPIYESMTISPMSESQELFVLNSMAALGVTSDDIDTEALKLTITIIKEEISENANRS